MNPRTGHKIQKGQALGKKKEGKKKERMEKCTEELYSVCKNILRVLPFRFTVMMLLSPTRYPQGSSSGTSRLWALVTSPIQ